MTKRRLDNDLDHHAVLGAQARLEAIDEEKRLSEAWLRAREPKGVDIRWAEATHPSQEETRRIFSQSLTSLTLTSNFLATSSGTLTYTGLAVPIRSLEPPGTPPFDQPGFAFGCLSEDSASGDQRTLLGRSAVGIGPVRSNPVQRLWSQRPRHLGNRWR